MTADSALFAMVINTGREPFAWGLHDCAMLAFDAVQAVTGRDPAPDLRGAYSTADEAKELLAGMGGLLGLCVKRFGPRIQAAAMQTGDVALLSQSLCQGVTAEHGALGVWWRGLIVARAEAGIVYLPVSSVLRAWRAA
jgi:hypothetical protein